MTDKKSEMMDTSIELTIESTAELAEKPSAELSGDTAKNVSLGTKAAAMCENFLFLGIAVVGLIFSMTATWGGGSGIVHAGVFPRIVLCIIGGGAIGMFFSNTKYAPPPEDRDVPQFFTIPFLLWVGVYVWCALNIGFVISTFIFLLFTIISVTTNPKAQWKKVLFAAALATILIWGIFVKIIGIALPLTPLF